MTRDRVIEQLLAGTGVAGTLASTRAVSGGDINECYHLTLRDGVSIFLKINRDCPDDFFAAEARNLEAMRAALHGVGVPRIMSYGPSREGLPAYLFMEYLAPGSASAPAYGELGGRLAALHRHTSAKFGWAETNYIGRTPQINTPHDHWVEFYKTCRLGPQLKRARDRGLLESGDIELADMLMGRLEGFLDKAVCGASQRMAPSLCHGDLWGGNVYPAANGICYLVDPACYYGYRETDLAMTRLFGGFPDDFYQGYREAWPPDPGFSERIPLWNLYHLLNHLNLFGASYYAGVRRILRQFGG